VQRLSKSGRIISISTTESFDNGVNGGSVATDFSGGDMVLQQTLIAKLFKVKDPVRGAFLHVLTLCDIIAFKISAAVTVIHSGTVHEADTAREWPNLRFDRLIPRKIKKVNQSHYRPEVPRGFQEVKVPRLRDNGPGWWLRLSALRTGRFYSPGNTPGTHFC
jgi:hypothetical protein